MLKKILKTLLLKDIFDAIIVGAKCIVRKPVTKKLTDIKRAAYFRRRLEITSSECILCELCVKVCPCNAISYCSTKKVSGCGELVVDSRKCAYCGLCKNACPKHAIKFISN